MRHFATLVFLLAVIITPAYSGPGMPEVPREEAQILHLNFEEGEGQRAADLSGSGNHGRISGEVKWVDGIIDNALEFEGEGYLELENQYNDMPELTVSFWIWQPDSEEEGRHIVGNSRGHGLGEAGFKFLKRLGPRAGNMQFRVSDGETGVLANTYDLPLEDWAHVAGVLKGGSIELFINGDMKASAGGASSTGISPSALRIGMNERGNETCLPGMRIDDLRIWDAALDESEIMLIYRDARPEHSEPEKVREVLSGKREEAKAEWWGFDPADSTYYLQSAMNSGAKKLIVGNTGSDWIVGPLKVPGNIEVVFKDGVVVRAKEGEFKARRDQLFNITEKENVTLRGEGNVLFEMRKADYRDPARYSGSGHRHTVNIMGSRNVLIQNLTLRSSGGDGVYISPTWTYPYKESDNIIIDRVVSEDHLRQGISITGGRNILLRDSVFNDTEGAMPQCGIDIEPNFPEGSIVNFVAENCDFNGNARSGIILALKSLDETSEPVSITFRDCRISGNDTGIRVHNTGSGTPEARGRIEFIDCVISGNRNESLSISQHVVKNMDLVFKNILIDNRDSRLEAFRISSAHPENIHGLRIEGLTVIEDEERPPIRFISRFGNGIVGAVVKDVKTVTSGGEERSFDAAAFLAESAPDPQAADFRTLPIELDRLRPASEKGRMAGAEIRYREKTDYLQYARAGQEIDLMFTNRPVHRFEAAAWRDPLQVEVYNPDGMVVDIFGVPFDETFNYTLKAGKAGVYRFKMDARRQTVSVETDAPGQGIAAAETLYILLCSGELFFQVPAGVKDIRIEAGGSPREASTVHIRDAGGRVVSSGVDMEGTKILSHTREDAAEDEIWSIDFRASKLYLRIGAPLVPVFSTAPQNLLVLEK